MLCSYIAGHQISLPLWASTPRRHLGRTTTSQFIACPHNTLCTSVLLNIHSLPLKALSCLASQQSFQSVSIVACGFPPRGKAGDKALEQQDPEMVCWHYFPAAQRKILSTFPSHPHWLGGDYFKHFNETDLLMTNLSMVGTVSNNSYTTGQLVPGWVGPERNRGRTVIFVQWLFGLLVGWGSWLQS